MSYPKEKFKNGECDCCGYETVIKPYRSNRDVRLENYNWFCDVCAGTHLSKCVDYPTQCSDTSLYASIGYIANMLLEEIKRSARASSDEKTKEDK